MYEDAEILIIRNEHPVGYLFTRII
jgi:hypothetical protein